MKSVIRNRSSRHLAPVLSNLAEKGYAGIEYEVRPHGCDESVLIMKKVSEDDAHGLFFCFVIAPWSEPYVEKVKDILFKHGVKYAEEEKEINLEGRPTPRSMTQYVMNLDRLIIADCGWDIALISKLMEDVFAIMGYDDTFLYDMIIIGRYAPISENFRNKDNK